METLPLFPRAAIIHVVAQEAAVDARTVKPYATGLRNSMALAFSSGQLYAGVNARDAINLADPSLADADLPHDTLLKVKEGGQYGWPYCYDNNTPNPEYPNYD